MQYLKGTLCLLLITGYVGAQKKGELTVAEKATLRFCVRKAYECNGDIQKYRQGISAVLQKPERQLLSGRLCSKIKDERFVKKSTQYIESIWKEYSKKCSDEEAKEASLLCMKELKSMISNDIPSAL